MHTPKVEMHTGQKLCQQNLSYMCIFETYSTTLLPVNSSDSNIYTYRTLQETNVVCKTFRKGYDSCCFALVSRSADSWNSSMSYNMVSHLANS